MMNSPVELKQQLNQLVEELKRYGAEKIVLFGSAARSDMDTYSDVDLVAIKPTTMSFVERLADVVRQCPGTLNPGLKADILVYTPEEFQRMQETGNPFIESVLRDGKVLYEKVQTAG